MSLSRIGGPESPPTALYHLRMEPRHARPMLGETRPILVVDDDPKIVRLVRAYLEREGYAVVEAGDGRAALAALERFDPALVVLDVLLPEMDGLAVARALRDRATTPVVMLSARGAPADRIAGLASGADDYMAKPFSPAELVLRVKRVLARAGVEPTTPRGRLGRGGLSVDLDRHEVSLDGRSVRVTAVEFRLLVALLEANGRVLSREQLLDAVYGREAELVLDRTIDVHVGRLRDRLGDRADAPRFVATVRGVGYRAAPGQTRPDLPRAG